MKSYKDPYTGDMLSASEHVSWWMQSLIRRWAFIGTITVLTAIVWIHQRVWEANPLDIWNYAASWMAIFIESVVGIAFFAQGRRDAMVMRESRAMNAQIATVVSHLETIMGDEFVVDRETHGLCLQILDFHKGKSEETTTGTIGSLCVVGCTGCECPNS